MAALLLHKCERWAWCMHSNYNDYAQHLAVQVLQLLCTVKAMACTLSCMRCQWLKLRWLPGWCCTTSVSGGFVPWLEKSDQGKPTT
jgi:hypothetical protein